MVMFSIVLRWAQTQVSSSMVNSSFYILLLLLLGPPWQLKLTVK